MSRWKAGCLAVIALAGGAALAKLPPPTPEEQKAAAEKKQLKAEQVRKEKEALERAQDRVVEHYRRSKGASAIGGSSSGTRAEDMPKTTKELPGGVGPEPQSPPSAEAHSGENR